MDDTRPPERGISDGIGAEGDDIRALFSFNLQQLASVSTRLASAMLETFGLSVQDWRTLAVLDFLGPASINRLAANANVQKSQMSRLVATLEARGLLEREANPEDARSSLLRLSATGRETVQAVLARSRERNAAMLSDLSHEERIVLTMLLKRVLTTTRGLL